MNSTHLPPPEETRSHDLDAAMWEIRMLGRSIFTPESGTHNTGYASNGLSTRMAAGSPSKTAGFACLDRTVSKFEVLEFLDFINSSGVKTLQLRQPREPGPMEFSRLEEYVHLTPAGWRHVSVYQLSPAFGAGRRRNVPGLPDEYNGSPVVPKRLKV